MIKVERKIREEPRTYIFQNFVEQMKDGTKPRKLKEAIFSIKDFSFKGKKFGRHGGWRANGQQQSDFVRDMRKERKGWQFLLFGAVTREIWQSGSGY